VSIEIGKLVAPYVHAAELKRLRAKRPESLEAYDFFLRARETMHNSSRTMFESAQKLFDASIARDPNYATALAWRAYWHALRIAQGWSPDVERDREDADKFAYLAVEADNTDPMALTIHGHLAGYLHQDLIWVFAVWSVHWMSIQTPRRRGYGARRRILGSGTDP
jgi:adenylate cyclase